MTAAHGSFIEGVEEQLPPGETIVWSGRPERSYLTRHLMHARGLAGYFLALLVVPALVADAGSRLAALLASAWWIALLGGGILLFAWFAADMIARTSIYVITDRRVVMRIGIAIPITLNLPLEAIVGVSMRERRGGAGDLALQLKPGERIAYVLLWPHARPWHLREPQPMMRGLPHVAATGAVLRRALGAADPLPATSRASSPDVIGHHPVLARP